MACFLETKSSRREDQNIQRSLGLEGKAASPWVATTRITHTVHVETPKPKPVARPHCEPCEAEMRKESVAGEQPRQNLTYLSCSHW